MDEVSTQAWVAEHLNAKPEAGVKVPGVYMAFTSPHPACTIGYIIMEYIAAPDCKNSDYEWVVQAVDTLIHIEVLPTSFIAYAMRKPAHNFTRKVAECVDYPQSSNFEAMAAVSY